MTDVRSLLKAKREEARVTHPLAAYSSSGQLRCIACGTTVKHSSAWVGHLGTKFHRARIARLKEEELERERREGDKIKADDEDTNSESEGSGSKRRKVHDDRIFAEAFTTPTFTKNPSHDAVEQVLSPPMKPKGPGNTHAAPSKDTTDLDSEWDLFQREVVHALDRQELYNRASLVAEPEFTSQTADGIPFHLSGGSQSSISTVTVGDEENQHNKELDERELIMDRLMDEEKAQEEADVKAALLRRRVDAFKQERRLARANQKSGISFSN